MIANTIYIPVINHINAVFNTTDTLEIWGYRCTAYPYVKEFRLGYTEVSAPTITSPVNNSISTSRTQNITWSGTAPFQYQVSSANDFSALLFNGTTANTYLGNLTLPVGLNYIRVRGYNEGINETNWSDTTIISIADAITTIGGSGYNWTTNGTFYNQTFDLATNERVFGAYYNTGCTDWPEPDNFTCTNNQLYKQGFDEINRRTTPNTTINMTDMDVTFSFMHAGNGSSLYIIGNLLRYQNYTYTYHWLNYAFGNNYLQKYTGSYSTINTTSYVIVPNTTYYSRSQVYGTNFKGKFWNTTEGTWTNEGTDSTILNGSAGYYTRGSIYLDNFWVRHLLSDGTLVTSGNYSLNFQDAGFGNKFDTIIPLINNSTSGLVNLSLNYSNNNASWTTVTYNEISNNTFIDIPDARYLYISDTINGTTADSPKLTNYTLTSITNNSVSGYVKYPNSTGVDSATIGYFNTWTTTNTSGYYQIENIPDGNITIATGKTGLNSSATILNFAGTNYNQNFTISTANAPLTNNVFQLDAYKIANYWIPKFNITGYIQSPDEDGTVINYNSYVDNDWGFQIIPVMAKGYSTGYNHTPEYLERLVSISNRYFNHINLSDTTGAEWYIWAMVSIPNDLNSANALNSSIYSSWNSTLTDFPITKYTCSYHNGTCYSGVGEDIYNQDTHIQNWGVLQANDEYRLYRNGYRSSQNRTDEIIDYYINQTTTTSGYMMYGESTPTIVYNSWAVYQLMELRDLVGMGYVHSNATQNTAFRDRLNASILWARYFETVDGDNFITGRSTGVITDNGIHIHNMAMGDGQDYANLDKQWQKIQQYVYYNDSTMKSYNPTKHYFNFNLKSGLATYVYRHKIDLMLAYQLLEAGNKYNSSIVEVPNTYVDYFNDTSQSGLSVGHYLNYSYTIYPGYWEDILGDENGSDVYPFRASITYTDATNFTIFPNPESTNNTTTYPYWNVPYMVNNTGGIVHPDLTAIIKNAYWPMTWENISTGGSIGYMYVNYSNIPMLETATQWDYYNISLNVSSSGVHERIEIGFDKSAFNISQIYIPYDYLIDDNRTQAVFSYNNSTTNLNFSRGAETVNKSNVSVTNGSFAGWVDMTHTIYDGYISIGVDGKFFMLVNVTQSPLVIEHDTRINTTNVYEYTLNQPPGVFSYSPDTPVTDNMGASRTFTATFTQNLESITWYINGNQVQQNLSVNSASYTNNSANMGTWNITAIASNAQGTAQQVWVWDVEGITVYNTGWQYIIVNDTTTMSNYGPLTGATWLANWNTTSQAFESHKVGWPYRTSTALTKGSGVIARFATNTTIDMTMNVSYNWTVATNWTLLGTETTRTLSELNTSLNSLGTCQVTNITYVNPITQVGSVYTCGSAGNASVSVPYGGGFWTFANQSFDRART